MSGTSEARKASRCKPGLRQAALSNSSAVTVPDLQSARTKINVEMPFVVDLQKILVPRSQEFW